MAETAQEIWLGGRVSTIDPVNPITEAIAVSNGRILAVGTDTQIQNLCGPGTKINKLENKFIMPGLIESHSHALWGACRELFDVFVGYQASIDQLIEAVQDRAKTTPKGTMLIGGPWRLDMRSEMGACPREILDAIAPEHPVALADTTQHSLWCNSKMLTLAGLARQSGDIEGGVIERDPVTGDPNGILAETACRPVRQLMVRSPGQLAEAARFFCNYFNSMGITAFKEPMAFEADLAAYKAADDRSELTVHMAAHLTKSSPLSPDSVSYGTLEDWRRKYTTSNIRTSFAKLFLDGVAPSHTASFLEPYLESSGYDVATHDPNFTLLIKPDELAETVSELDRRGFVTKMHAVGDNAVRTGLDAIEVARKANGFSGLRHEIAHSPFVAESDISRFSALDAVAEVSPKLWFPNPATAAQIAVLGQERVDRCHPIRSLLEAGAEVIYASDWPAAAPNANPWIGLGGMLSRTDPTGIFEGSVGADQAITLDQALPLFTVNGARSLGMENQTGMLKAGHWADFIILDRPLNEMTSMEIGNIEVDATYWKGQMVYGR